MSHRGIGRRGTREDCELGGNDQSWSLKVIEGHYSFYHNNSETVLRALFSSSSLQPSGRVSVLLDSEAGSLSFFHVKPDGELSHLHTCTSSFTEPVFPGFGLWCDGSSVSVSVTDHRRAPSAGLK
ncbi:unnamed protein product [Knipowitschia caucasica]